MQDPYRLTDAETKAPPRVLARRNRWRPVWHLGIIAALLGVAAWVTTTDFGQRVPWLLGAFAALMSFDVVRTLHEATLPHRVTADSRGIELSWTDKAPWRPWMRRHNAAIAWDQLIRVRTRTVEINGSSTSELIIVRQDGPTLTIPDSIFDHTTAQVQIAILDEREDRIEAPRREAADVAGYCRDRFAEPVTLQRQVSIMHLLEVSVIVVLGAAMAGIVVAVFGGVIQVVVTGSVIVVTGLVLYAVWRPLSPRVLRLSSEGVGHGPSESDLALVPWSKIRFARPTVINRRTTSVVVAVQGGKSLLLEGDYGVPLQELAMMIAPPVELVQAQREQQRAEARG